MRRIITGYLVSYSDGDQVRQALFTDQPWHDPALESSIDRGTAQAVLLPEYSINSEIYFQPQGTESSVSLSDLSLDNTDARFDPWSRYIVSGMDIECRRGYFDQPWSEWDIRMRGKCRGRPEFIGREKMVIGVRDRFDWLRTPVAREVFDDDTPNTRLINTTVPLVFGEVFQASVPMIDPNIQAYFLAGNLGRINAAAEGGNPKALFERHGNIGQLLQQPLLKVTWNFGGPPSGVEGIVDLLEDVGSFDNWTAGQPDGFTVIEQTAGVTVTEEDLGTEGTGLGVEVTGGGDIVSDWQAATAQKVGGMGHGGDWTPIGTDDMLEAVQNDDTLYIRGAPSGFPPRTRWRKFSGFGWGVPNDAVIDDIELRITYQDDPDFTGGVTWWGGPWNGIAMRLADDTFLREKLRNVDLPATKTTTTLNNWGIDVTPEQLNDAGFGFSFAISRNEGESARGRIYHIEARVKYTTGELDEYRLEREIALVPGTRYRIRITGMQDGESATVDFGGIETTGDPIPSPQDDFSSNTINVEGFTAAEATFIPRGSILVLRFRKGVGTTGKQIFSQIEILADSPVVDRLHPLTRYTAELYGEDPDEVVDNAAVEAVQNLAGNPPLGWYVRREITGEELLRLWFRSCGSECFTSPKGVISAAQMRPPQQPDGDYLAFDGKRFADLGTSEPDTGPNLTDRVHAARNVDPIVEDRTAEITTTWTEADRQMVITDWRITERARFDDLQGFEPIVPPADPLPNTADSIEALGGELVLLDENSTPQSGGSLTINGQTLHDFDCRIIDGPVTIGDGWNSAGYFTAAEDSASAWVVVKGDLTIDAGEVFTPPNRKLFTVVYVDGDLTVNGEISMSKRGANHSESGSDLAAADIRIYQGTIDSVENPHVPASGADGGDGYTATTTGNYAGNDGAVGVDGQTGGGGSGGHRRFNDTGTTTMGEGSDGTAFSGGAGAGGAHGGSGSFSVDPAETRGGKGSDAVVSGSTNLRAGGGAGNPGGAKADPQNVGDVEDGDDGTGGTLIIIVTGAITGSGSITAKGADGGDGVPGGGGASGGGSINVLCGSHTGVTFDVSGGVGGASDLRPGGDGGDGTDRVLEGLT